MGPDERRHSYDFKTSTILVYMILSGKQHITGCGLYIDKVLFVYFNISNKYEHLFLRIYTHTRIKDFEGEELLHR